MSAEPPVLELKARAPLKSGMNRLIFQHPFYDDRLIKIVRRDILDEHGVFRPPGRGKTKWYKGSRRHGPFMNFARELDEYLAIRVRHTERLPFIQQIHGFAETDLGFGLVVEKLCGADGQLAPTLAALVQKHGLTGHVRKLCDTYLAALISFNVVTANSNPHNVVCASDHHGERLVMVDGLGEKSFIPLQSLSRFFNRRATERRWRRTMQRLEARFGGRKPSQVATP